MIFYGISLQFTGEGNGNPLQYSCLEDPSDGGAWWAAVYGVTQSQTRLKRLSSSSNRFFFFFFYQNSIEVKILVLEVIFKNPNQSPSHFIFHEVRTFGIK